MDKKLVKDLIELAKGAWRNSYSPYSKYPVGASVSGLSGRIYTGCNIENASFGLSICAERVAIFKAISEGERKIKDICVVAKGAAPCGACRQVMIEFSTPDSNLIIVDYDPVKKIEKVEVIKVSRLLYKPFKPEKLF